MSFNASALLTAAVLVFVGAAPAQQFQYRAGVVTGPLRWSEGVEALDANGDGFMDVIFSNGAGFTSGSGAFAPTLLIHQGNAGTPIFVDETATRIPVGFTQQGKGLCICDVNGDGHPDVVFANAFGTLPRVLVNDGAGVFADETSTRFPNITLNSFGVANADVDDDGDVDLIFSDASPNFLSTPGKPPRLYINDGTGVFTDSPARMNGVNKVAAMQVSAVDIDQDLDLDIIIDGRSVGQHLYLNDGAGNFTFAGANILPPGSSSIYETDWIDLDLDGDVDGFYTSMSGFQEGSAMSNFAQTGILSFVGSTTTLSGLNGNDDNEIAFIDANMDGLLDVLVASLGNSREKLYLNAGTFATGSFAYQANGFSVVTDSTLDLAIADFDLDGRYDVVTAQGESGSFLNRYYENTGPVDTIPPVIGTLEALSATTPLSEALGGGLKIHARIQDATADSGRTFVSSRVLGTIVKDGVSVTIDDPMNYSGGYVWRWALSGTSLGSELVGADVTLAVEARDEMMNVTTSAAQVVRVCGVNSYGVSSPVNAMNLTAAPDPTLGQVTTVTAAGGPAAASGFLVVSPGRADIGALGGNVYIAPLLASLLPITTDGSGAVVLPVPIGNVPSLEGTLIRTQLIFVDPSQAFGYTLSTGLEAAVCGQ